MLITAFYTPHTNLTSSSHTTQPVSTGFSEWTSFHITTLYTRFALYFGGHDYRPHGSLATAAARSSVLLSYTLRPSNRHYFLSKSFSPSSQYIALEKKNLTCGGGTGAFSFCVCGGLHIKRHSCRRQRGFGLYHCPWSHGKRGWTKLHSGSKTELRPALSGGKS